MEVIRNMKQSDNAFLGLGVKFPALVDAPGVAPWNPNQLDIWAAESADDRERRACRKVPAESVDAGT
jgi:hypothetical protein